MAEKTPKTPVRVVFENEELKVATGKAAESLKVEATLPFQVLEVTPAVDLEVVVVVLNLEEELTLAAHVALIVIVDVMVMADLAVAVEVVLVEVVSSVLVEVVSSMGVKRCVLNYDMCFFVLVFFGVCIDR